MPLTDTADPPVPGPGPRSAPGSRNQRIAAAVLTGVLVVAAIAVVKLRSGGDAVTAPAPTTQASAALPRTDGSAPAVSEFPAETVTIPDALASTIPRLPDPLPGPPFTTVTPRAAGQLTIFAAPDGAVARTLPNPRLINDDPNAAVPLVMLVKAAAPVGWYEVYLPVRPNGSTGFVRATDVTTSPHDYHIEVRLSAFNLKAYRGTRLILDVPIAVATDNTPTPGGTYYTTELIKPPDPDGPYGTYAYGLSGFSEVLQSFNGGPGQLGIHGTNQPWAMGQKVSSGCIRLRNADIEQLAGLLPLGVPVQIYA